MNEELNNAFNVVLKEVDHLTDEQKVELVFMIQTSFENPNDWNNIMPQVMAHWFNDDRQKFEELQYKSERMIRAKYLNLLQNKCRCGENGKERKPHLANESEAESMKYYACDKCFNATWAGES